MCVILLFSLLVLEAPRLGRQLKQVVVKNNTIIRGHVSVVDRLRGPIYLSVNRLIYSTFISLEGKFINFDRRMSPCLL
jgi:hypothetical protein